MQLIHHLPPSEVAGKRRKLRRWVIPAVLAAVVVPILVVEIALMRAGPILKGRVVETLKTRFGSDVQLDTLRVSIANGVKVSGTGLRIFPVPEVMAAGDHTPVISVGRFDFQASIPGLIFKPTHVGTVYVHGLAIHIPRAGVREKAGSRRHLGKIKIRVDAIVCDDSQLVIDANSPSKDPKVFHLKHIVLRDLGPNASWPYDAILSNPIPKGEIHATGTFGPWNTETPGESQVSGKYVFQHADLNTIKGLGGILQSDGSFDGRLDRISVQGKTYVPDFSLDTANHPMPLATEFQAIVDGTSGDTYLNQINARLGRSQFTCKGAVVNVKGRGHTVNLAVDVPSGQMGDFLELAVKTTKAAISGTLALNASIDIGTGNESVTQKLAMKGEFSLAEIHFTDPQVEDKVDILSLRARGQTENLKPGAPDVHSRMVGEFSMRQGKLTFPHLEYTLPGGNIELSGTYRLQGRVVDFTGKVHTKAEVSQMLASKWKSFLLKPIDPFFKKHGWGAVIPVKITGNNGKVHVGYKF